MRSATSSDQSGFGSYLLIKRMSRAAEDVAYLVPHQLFDPRAGWAEILAWIELLRVFRECLPDGRGHCQAQIRVNIDLGAAGAPGDFDVRLRHARRIGSQLAAVLIDLLHQVLGDARSPVQHQRIIAESRIHERLLDGFEPLQVKVLFAFKLIRPVRVADGYRRS